MQDRLDWNDLSLFCLVARAGSLTEAASQARASAATLSRRMKALEAAMGRRLFLHGAQGYALTPDGRALLERAAGMEAAAAEVCQWRAAGAGPVRVRLSAGTWTSQHLARHLPEFWRPDAGWVPEFVQCNLEMDIARREIDIGIRNRRPDRPWLAGRRTALVDYAVYARGAEVTGWIALSEDVPQTPTSTWVRAHHGANIVTTANDPRLALALAEAGVGRVVLPCFVGERAARLARLSDPIEALRSEEWLVSHHEARHEPAIRAALDALAGFLSGRARSGADGSEAPG